jgi:hypothetical protein
VRSDRTLSGHGTDAAAQPHQGPAALIGDLLGVIKAYSIPVVHPFKRHPGDIGPQNLLTQSPCHKTVSSNQLKSHGELFQNVLRKSNRSPF